MILQNLFPTRGMKILSVEHTKTFHLLQKWFYSTFKYEYTF